MKQTINPIGQEINTLGKVINNKELMLVHLHLKSGEQIPSHDHKGQEVFFTIVAGTVEVGLDDTEIHQHRHRSTFPRRSSCRRKCHRRE